MPAAKIADGMRKALCLEPEWLQKHSTCERAFSHLPDVMDHAGVMRTASGIVKNNTRHKLDPDEFQGFALIDDYALLVFVNGADYKAAHMFTAAHELAHVFIGSERLSGLDRTMPVAAIQGSASAARSRLNFYFPRIHWTDFRQKGTPIQGTWQHTSRSASWWQLGACLTQG